MQGQFQELHSANRPTLSENAVGQDASLLPVSSLSADADVNPAQGLCVVRAEISSLRFEFAQDGR